MQHLSSVGFIFVFSRVTLVAYNKMSMTCHARREISTQTDDENQPQATSTGQREHPSASLCSPQQKRTVVRRTTRVPSVAHSVVDRLMRPFSKQSSSAYAAAAHAAPVSSVAKAPWPIISQLRYPSGAPQFSGCVGKPRDRGQERDRPHSQSH